MKTGIIFLFVCIRLCVQGQPVNEKEVLPSSCIVMTPEREKDIQNIVEEINIFIQNLSDKHEDIDFTLFQLTIENHSDDELYEKETVLKMIINDCKHNGNKTSDVKYLPTNFDYEESKLAEETVSEEKTEPSNASIDDITKADDSESDLESQVLGSNDKINEKQSETNESVTKNKETPAKSEESGEESSLDKKDNKTERDNTSENGEIENLIKDLEDLNGKQHLSDKENSVYIFAPNIDNSKVELNNHYDELYKNLYYLAIQKLANTEIELEKLKQTKVTNIKDLINKVSKNIRNPYYGFGGNVFDNYVNDYPSNTIYGLEV